MTNNKHQKSELNPQENNISVNSHFSGEKPAGFLLMNAIVRRITQEKNSAYPEALKL